MYLALDVHYRQDAAKSVGVGFLLPSEKIETTVIEYVNEVEEYQPGQFYKRELPCLIKVLRKFDLTLVDAVIIDGNVFVGNSGELGLGGKLWEALGKNIPVIGVAKNKFESNKETVVELWRGQSKKPLYISSIGMANDEAAGLIAEMKGENRFPDLLKKVDSISKEP